MMTTLPSRDRHNNRARLTALLCVMFSLACACEEQRSSASGEEVESGESEASYTTTRGGAASGARERRDAKGRSRAERDPSTHQFKDGALSLEIDHLIIARDVKHRRAIGAATSFPNTVESLWGLASVRARGHSAELSLRWWRGQELISVNPFVVSEGIKWSEWSQVTISPKSVGSWRVELFYPERALTLLTADFKVTEAPHDPLMPLKSERQSARAQVQGEGQRTGERAGEGAGERVSALSLREDKRDRGGSPQRDALDGVIKIKRLEVARAVKRRRPLGIGTRFTLDDERLWGYIEVANPERPQHVWMEWSRDDQLRSRLKVRVGVSRAWRTWSWQRLSRYDAGRWRLKVTSSSGELLAQTHFIVSASR